MTSTTLYHRIGQNCFTVISLLALLFLTTDTAFAQGWLRHYPSGNGEEPRQLVIAPNGDFVFGGVGFENNQTHFYLQRNDANGNKSWYKTIEPVTQPIPPYLAALHFLENCQDGGFIGGGAIKINDQYVEVAFKTSNLGDLLWVFIPDSTHNGFLYSVVEASDGNLLITGTRKIGAPGLEILTPFLYKLNLLDGTLIWAKTFTDHQLPESGGSVLCAPDGSIWQAGNAVGATVLRHLDADGNLLHFLEIATISPQRPILYHTSDGFSITIYESSENVRYRRYDYSGNLLASKDTDDVVFLISAGTASPSGTAFTITLQSSPSAYESPRMYKMDFEGNVEGPIFPLEGFSLGPYYLAQNIKSTTDGGFIIIGANLGQATWFALKIDSMGQLDPAYMSGNVFRDEDQDCIKSVSEPNLSPILVRAADLSLGVPWYETSDSSGNFVLAVATGDYEVEALAPAGTTGYWESCPSQMAMLPLPLDSMQLTPFGLKPLVDCPFLQLSLGAGIMRPCSTTVLNVKVLNAGTSDADSAIVRIEIDPALTYESSTLPLVAQNGNQLWFKVEPVSSLQNVQFSIQFLVDCDAEMGQVFCYEGHVSPDSICVPLDSLWDRAELKINAFCDADSVKFQVLNIGNGNMNQASELVIIEDYIILLSIPLQLQSGQDTLITLANPNGQTYYGRIRQTEGFPGDAFASDGKDFCDGNGSSGMLLQYPLFAGGPFDARFCDEVRTSFDPNDKRGLPLGYGSTHYIDRGVPIDYRIRFQNTGNDTAFNITVLDTLPEFLDVASLRLGSASHDFTWKLSGEGILAFHFANILLPDSSTNEPLSHGFVNFKLLPKTTIPAGTLIQNRAAIYFDYNAPVFTDFAQHTVDSNFIPTRIFEALQPIPQISISPNPAVQETVLDLGTLFKSSRRPILLTYTDVLGKILRQETVLTKNHTLTRQELPAGLCFLKLTDSHGSLVGSGKLVWMPD